MIIISEKFMNKMQEIFYESEDYYYPDYEIQTYEEDFHVIKYKDEASFGALPPDLYFNTLMNSDLKHLYKINRN